MHLMDKSPGYLAWSPCHGMVAFNPVITPTTTVLPLTPFIATPMPFFVFSPQNQNVVPAHQQSAITYQQPSFFTPAPILQPAPGSKESSTPRKRRLHQLKAQCQSARTPNGGLFSPSVKRFRQTTSIRITDKSPINVRPETPSYPERYALSDDEGDDVQVKPDPHAPMREPSSQEANFDPNTKLKMSLITSGRIAESQVSLRTEPVADHAGITRIKLEEEEEAPMVTPKSEPLDYEYNGDSNDSDSDFQEAAVPTGGKKTRRPRTLKHLKLSSDTNWLDNVLVTGGLNSPVLVGRLYSCPKCPKTYKLRKHCRRHMVSHTNAKPFTCEKCEAGFSRQDSWQRHLKRCKK